MFGAYNKASDPGRGTIRNFKSNMPGSSPGGVAMTTFVTSDTHFGHANIIKYCNRPFADVDEMNRELVRRWNETVSADDWVYHLGDFAFYNHGPILDQLNGHKFLIAGNHDGNKTKKLTGWASVWQGPTLVASEDCFPVWMDHFPTPVGPNAIKLHGHSHLPPEGRLHGKHKNMIDVGVDAWDYRPTPLKKVLELIK